MRATSRVRNLFTTLLMFVSSLSTCPYRVLDNAETWNNMFSDDHDSEFFLNGVTSGFSYAHTDVNPGGEFYVVSNYVPEAHYAKLDDRVGFENTLEHLVHISREKFYDQITCNK